MLNISKIMLKLEKGETHVLNHSQRSDIRDAYEKWANQYDSDSKWNPAIQIEGGEILHLLDPQKKEVILEIGCGTGRLTRKIAKRCRKIIGIDFSERMLEAASKNSRDYENIEYELADIRKTPLDFKKSSFDKIVCPLTINHVGDIKRLFRETYRLLRSGGTLVFDDVNPDGYVSPAYKDTIYEMSQRGKKIFYHHSIDSLVHNLHRTGFEIEQMKFTRVDERIRPLITKSSFDRNKGRTFGVIVRAKKG